MIAHANVRRVGSCCSRLRFTGPSAFTGLVGFVASMLLTAAPAHASLASAPPTLHKSGVVAAAAHARRIARTPRMSEEHARLRRGDALRSRRASLHRRLRLSPGEPMDFANVPDAMLLPDAAAPDSTGPVIERGIASWYGGWRNGRRMSDGGIFDDRLLTAAHPWLPLGTRVRVTLAGTGSSVVVTITDRQGTRRRAIDLSRAAARELGIVGRGTAMVTLTPG